MTETTWRSVELDDLEEEQSVRITVEAIVEVDVVDSNWVTFSDSEGDNEFRIERDSTQWNNSIFKFEVEDVRDIRAVKDLVANPASVSNRRLRGADPYGTPFDVIFQGSMGFNVFPSGTVTISAVGSIVDPVYIRDGINGTLEVV